MRVLRQKKYTFVLVIKLALKYGTFASMVINGSRGDM